MFEQTKQNICINRLSELSYRYRYNRNKIRKMSSIFKSNVSLTVFFCSNQRCASAFSIFCQRLSASLKKTVCVWSKAFNSVIRGFGSSCLQLVSSDGWLYTRCGWSGAAHRRNSAEVFDSLLRVQVN